MLRGRVGRVLLTTDGGACDVTIDDQAAGTTPLDTPLLVSVGPRKIAVHCAGDRAAHHARVEVVAGETAHIDIKVPPPPIAAVRAAMNGPAHDAPPATPGKGWLTGWIVAGVLVAATVALGATTLVEQSRLTAMRNSYPAKQGDLVRQST